MTQSQIHKNSLLDLFNAKIKNKHPKDLVKQKIIKVGKIDRKIFDVTRGLYSRDIFISTKALMHIYERRNRLLTEKLIPQSYSLLCYPARIFQNTKSRHSGVILAKEYNNNTLIAVLEEIREIKYNGYHIVTMFIANERYLRGLKCLWNGRTATPSSQYVYSRNKHTQQ